MFLQPHGLADALAARAEYGDAVALQGGTDVYVEVNFGRLRPVSILDLGRVDELRGIARDNGTVRIGAGATYHEMIGALGDDAPALVIASRTVGSPPIRNRGTIGGNLGSASPAGDCHPPLLAAGATVELASSNATRFVPAEEFFVGPKRSVLAADEVIVAVHLARATGPQSFSKVGVRNAMVIAVCSFAIALHAESGRVGTGIGSAGPVPLRARDAEQFLEGHLDESGRWQSRAPLEESAVRHFGELVAAGARPIDDVRGTAAYRRHALGVLAGRSLTWCWDEFRGGVAMRVRCTVNGRLESVELAEFESLLQLLRDHLGLTGTKNACEQGECGSCSVFLDGVLVCSCLVGAGQAEGRAVTTIEGISDGAVLNAVQAAFVQAGAVQCGFCTPGLVMSAQDLLQRIPDPDDDEIREVLAGNLCRCTGYQKIIDAVHEAARATTVP